MIANYHTHTCRCGHAKGSEREYVEAAIQKGLKILGFADHTPQPFQGGYGVGTRMQIEELEDYAKTILALKEEYASEIEIHLGLEVEYFPAVFETLLKNARDCGVEYFLLAQHLLGNGINEPHVGQPFEDTAFLHRYYQQVEAAIQTGAFSYIAHPDIIRFEGDKAVYEQEMRNLCKLANQYDMPLELNLVGIRYNFHYPNELFWEIAGQENCQVILGSDAHDPQLVKSEEDIERAKVIVEKFGLHLIDRISLRSLLTQ